MVERVSGDFAMVAIVGKGARTRPDPWPSLGIVTIDPDAYSGSASLLKGEQNIGLPRVGSEQDATQPAPQNSSSSFYPPFHRHLTPSRARIRRERVLPLSGTPPKPVAPNP